MASRYMHLEMPGDDRDRWRDSRLPGELVSQLIEIARTIERPAGQREKRATFSVYVVLLEDVKEHPGYSLYVGRTGLTPRARYLNHKRGHKASRSVRKHGLGLLPALYGHLNPLESTESIDIEVRLAEALRLKGIYVIQN